jgi:hypothetical protein
MEIYGFARSADAAQANEMPAELENEIEAEDREY